MTRTLLFGFDDDNRPLEQDFVESGHIMLYGDGRSGMRSVQHELISQIESWEESSIIVFDPLRVLYPKIPRREQDKKFKETEEFGPVLEDVCNLIEERGKQSGSHEPLVLMLASISHYLDNISVLKSVRFILQRGIATSVHAIVDMQSAWGTSSEAIKELVPYCETRMVLGRGFASHHALMLERPRIDDFSQASGKRGYAIHQRQSEPDNCTILHLN